MKTNTSTFGRAKRWRFTPFTNLQPATVTRHLDAFEAGHLRDAALLWDALEQRDDLLRGVISKRKKSVARHGWAVLPVPGLSGEEKARAAEHAQALEHFYNHLECEHAVDTTERGGFKLLARQMMDAVGKRFAVHEIIWRDAEGTKDTARRGRSGAAVVVSGANRRLPRLVEAKFRFVPLAFFENTTGRLRFLEQDFAQDGRALESGAWMITVGEGLMIASSAAWMLKHLSLDDWMKYSQHNGTPTLRGISAAARGSAEWTGLESALVELLNGQSIVHSSTESIELLDLAGSGRIPFPQLVERIDRMLAALWRGADLSTLSRDRGYGASLQEKETCALEEDDAEMLTETLNHYVDAWVIRHVFGADEKPLARVKVLVSPRECTTEDLRVDEFLIRNGAPLSIRETMSRYGRALPKPGEPVFVAGSRKASLHESSQKLGSAEVMDNEGSGCGPTVSFRGCSPSAPAQQPNGGIPRRGRGDETLARCEGDTQESGDAILSKEVLATSTSTSNAMEPEAGGLPLENQFTLLQEDWLQLAPYGDFPHARGIQRVDRTAADTMVAQFNSFRGRLGRLFGGVPFYVGHPDLPGASETADRKAYGWITELAAREEGIFGRVKWSESGLDLLRNAHFKFYSPYWEAREIGAENGRRIYRPVALISVGLTNQPNIPVRPLANETASVEDDVRSLPSHAGNGPAPDPVAIANYLPMHTVSCTEGLALRKAELVRLPNRRDRIHECVLAKMRLGLSYDQAWDHVKGEHPAWFSEPNQ